MADETSETNLLELATELTIAWLSNSNTRASAKEVPAFLEKMHTAVAGLAAPQAQADQTAASIEYTPAITARRSLGSKDHILSMIDGKPYKTLKRHLAGHGLTPTQYRERYGLKSDYPMVAENYASMRRDIAKKLGLGRKSGQKASAAKSAAKPKTARQEKAAAKEAPAPAQS